MHNVPQVKDVWETFWSKFWNENRFVLYAQRHWLNKFFPDYNPAAPDQLEDSDRPFDWDHIFPQKNFYNKRGLLSLWRDWPYTIGNVRAWPMELNRSDQDDSPAIKMNDVRNENGELIPSDSHWVKKFYLNRGENIRKASFVSEENWKYWQQFPEKNDLQEASDNGNALLKAITDRLCALYRHWYESLDVGSSFGSNDSIKPK